MSKEIGKKIKIMRGAKHISQNELAKKAGIAQSTLSYIESGKKNPQFDTLSAICRGLETTVLDLLTFEEQKIRKKLFEQNAAVLGNLEEASKLSFRSLLPENALKELYEFERYLYHKYKQTSTK